MCEKCPCPNVCMRLPFMCQMAMAGQDRESLLEICEQYRKAIYGHLDRVHPAHTDHASADVRVIEDAAMGRLPPIQAQTVAPPVSESLDLIRRMKSCRYRSTHPPCGCQGGRCALRRGAIVSHADCFECLRRYG